MKIKKEIKYDIDIPEFCAECGNKMIVGKRKISRYDDKTGKAESYQYTVKCEKICGLQFFLNSLQVHDNFLVVDTPYSCFTEKPHRTILEII